MTSFSRNRLKYPPATPKYPDHPRRAVAITVLVPKLGAVRSLVVGS